MIRLMAPRAPMTERALQHLIRIRGRAVRWLKGVRRLSSMVEIEITTRAENEERLADLVAARRETAAWKARSQRGEDRIAELEAEAVASELVVTDLRARLVCLHGKLAATAATARYQSFATALGSRTRDA